jgi:hypothetical protein
MGHPPLDGLRVGVVDGALVDAGITTYAASALALGLHRSGAGQGEAVDMRLSVTDSGVGANSSGTLVRRVGLHGRASVNSRPGCLVEAWVDGQYAVPKSGTLADQSRILALQELAEPLTTRLVDLLVLEPMCR